VSALAMLQGDFDAVAWQLGAPDLVHFEMPFSGSGNAVHPQSFFMVGVVLQALFVAFGSGPVIVDVGPMVWKAAALGKGKGHAGKGAVLRWAREACAYEGECAKCGDGTADICAEKNAAHDEADALAIVTGAGVAWRKQLDAARTDALR
jgi:hypothetical protein